MSPTYKIFYSSRNPHTFEMWCPDCSQIEPLLASTFALTDPQYAPPRPSIPLNSDALPEVAKERLDADIVYVGDKEEWKSRDNKWRGKPWEITAVPTLLKMEGDEVVGRLVEGEINKGKLEEFLAK